MFTITNRQTGRTCAVSANSIGDICDRYGIELDDQYPNDEKLAKGKLKDKPEILVSVQAPPQYREIQTRSGLVAFFTAEK